MTDGKLDIELVQVTPKLAAEWMEVNFMNRRIRATDVERYAADMKAGRWHLTGDPVKFDTEGVLSDGQHRLAAVVKSGITVPFYVARNLDPTARIVIDEGRKRVFSDDLAMNGQNRTVQTEALLRKILHWEKTQTVSMTGGSEKTSRAVLAERYPEFAQAIHRALEIANGYSKIPAGVPATGFVAWLLLRGAPEDLICRYMQILSIGSLDEQDEPLVALRDKLERDRTNAKVTGKRNNTGVAVWHMIRGWNAWINGEKISMYGIPKNAHKVPFPLPVQVEVRNGAGN